MVVLLHESLMASWSAVQVPSTPKTQAPVLPEPGLLHGRLRSARRIASNIAKAAEGLVVGVDLDKGLEKPSRDQAKQDERAQAEQL